MFNTLTQTLHLSRDILEKCQNDEWDKVEALETARAKLMHPLASLPAPNDSTSAEGCRKMAIEIKTLNQEILLLTQQNKQQLLDEIRVNNKSKRMLNAYS